MNSLKFNFRLRRIATILSIAILTLAIIASISGIAIAFYYQPTARDAHQSLEQIKGIIPNGWLIFSLHNWAGNGIIAVCLIQIIVLFLNKPTQKILLKSN
jgi:cytochrome b6